MRQDTRPYWHVLVCNRRKHPVPRMQEHPIQPISGHPVPPTASHTPGKSQPPAFLAAPGSQSAPRTGHTVRPRPPTWRYRGLSRISIGASAPSTRAPALFSSSSSSLRPLLLPPSLRLVCVCFVYIHLSHLSCLIWEWCGPFIASVQSIRFYFFYLPSTDWPRW